MLLNICGRKRCNLVFVIVSIASAVKVSWWFKLVLKCSSQKSTIKYIYTHSNNFQLSLP